MQEIDVVAQLGVAPDSVTMATSFTIDLGANPIGVIELEFALGEEFDACPIAFKASGPKAAPSNVLTGFHGAPN
jgi:hypothetical protein